MRFKTLICTVLMLCLVLAACGKGDATSKDNSFNKTESASKSSRDYLTLLYSNADSFNPYTVKTDTNRQIVKLLYEPLVKINDKFEAVNSVASSVNVEGNVCTVSLKTVKFSDGTDLTAEDVVYSCELARNSETGYKDKLYEVQSVKADGKKVIFTLSKNDPYFVNLLTFPILKKGTENLKNEDNVEIVPTGAGAFVFSEKETALIKNTNYYGKTNVNRITLVDAPDRESYEHYVEIGATDYYLTDPINGNIVRMSGKKMSLNTTGFVYLGINHSYGKLSDPLLRQAISSALDREVLAKTVYYDHALPTAGFFHPDFKDAAGYQTVQPKADTKISIENLEQIGYNSLDADGLRLDGKGKTLNLTLLVNNSNPTKLQAANLIKTQLRAVGINVTVNSVSDDAYFSALQNGHFQLYLGEVNITPNMDVAELVTPGKKAAYGIPSGAVGYTAVLEGYAKGENGIGEIATSLINEMPMIPLLYRNRLLFYTDEADVGQVSANDIFLSITHFE